LHPKNKNKFMNFQIEFCSIATLTSWATYYSSNVLNKTDKINRVYEILL